MPKKLIEENDKLSVIIKDIEISSGLTQYFKLNSTDIKRDWLRRFHDFDLSDDQPSKFPKLRMACKSVHFNLLSKDKAYEGMCKMENIKLKVNEK